MWCETHLCWTCGAVSVYNQPRGKHTQRVICEVEIKEQWVLQKKWDFFFYSELLLTPPLSPHPDTAKTLTPNLTSNSILTTWIPKALLFLITKRNTIKQVKKSPIKNIFNKNGHKLWNNFVWLFCPLYHVQKNISLYMSLGLIYQVAMVINS